MTSVSDGAAVGYRAGRTLGLRTELRRQLKRRRTTATFGFLVALPLILIGAFALGSEEISEGNAQVNLVDVATSGGLNFVLFVLFATTGFFLVVVYALFFGDTVASEAGWGSLRYLLAAPVPRARLLRQKFLVATFLSVTAVVTLVVVSLVAGTIAYGWNPVRTPVGLGLDETTALIRLLAIVAYLASTLIAVGSLAFLLSVATDAPLAAVGGAVFTIIVASILDTIDALGSIRDFLPTQNQYAWVGMLAEPADSADMFTGCLQALAYT
ncbi:MAG: ABC transporter permease subunit, partial [Geodermatophilaceae bacterium]|nr:ABC transporter permease subunit [Geodermatophilaceae bacterium]